MELHSIQELSTPNGIPLFRGYDSAGQRWSFHPGDEDHPERWHASVTAVLEIFIPRQLKEWWVRTNAAEIQRKSGAAMERGNKIHKAIAQGKKPKSVAERLEVLHSEVSVYSPRFGVAGTIDTVGLLDGEPFILDYKSGKNYGIKTGWQLSAYRWMWNELMGEWRGMAGVHIPPGKEEQRVFTYEHMDFCWLAFLSCFQIWKSLNYNSLKRMGWHWLNDQVVEVAGGRQD